MDPALRSLQDTLRGRRLVVLTGAGCSTESGIPDYRGPNAPQRDRSPILYQRFIKSPRARARYWAGSVVGWPRVARARPNPAHRALSRLERAGFVQGVITQNVDGLHRAAGSLRVVELHGNLERVICLDCGARERRAVVQRRLQDLNPDWPRRAAAAAPDGDAELAPDGDTEPPSEVVQSFRVPGCRDCGGVLKPDVVFFGENVPPERVADAWRLYEEGDVLLVVGSSLTVYSGRRFVERAGREGRPVAIVNLGATRGDPMSTARVDARAGAILPQLADALIASSHSRSPALHSAERHVPLDHER